MGLEGVCISSFLPSGCDAHSLAALSLEYLWEEDSMTVSVLESHRSGQLHCSPIGQDISSNCSGP